MSNTEDSDSGLSQDSQVAADIMSILASGDEASFSGFSAVAESVHISPPKKRQLMSVVVPPETVKKLKKTSASKPNNERGPDRIGRINQNITLDAYKKKELCPVYTLKYYLKATKKLRKDDYLLASFRTWRKISTSTLARWLKIVLTSSGIDVTKFQAHSFRGASTSAAFSAGITLDTIMKTANWKSAKTFKKFYLTEVEAKGGVKTCKKKFINAVLSV
ncbi:unnamed protein product [Mytilus coruscus]|uniref:Uncharacterized protein n=1 Tax=Mytilus coruscus TaxID=42192 RepID=A0A6J8ERE5_MYTCO|nr:unnamed protein product [Mytilus coruscus]